MLGLGGGIAGLIGALGQPIVAAALVVGAVRADGHRLCAAHSRRSRDATSAVAALVTLAIGFLAGSGSAGLAIAVRRGRGLHAGACATRLHGFVGRLDER